MRARGFVSVELVLALLAMAALGYGVWWIRSDALKGVEAKNATERAERTEMISSLALELSKRGEEAAKERADNAAALAALRQTREGDLHAFVPAVAGSDTCIRAGFVRYVNAAAAGVPAGLRPEPGVATAPAGVGTDTVAAIIGRNYDKYNDCKAKVGAALKEFDSKRGTENAVINAINARIHAAERKVQ